MTAIAIAIADIVNARAASRAPMTAAPPLGSTCPAVLPWRAMGPVHISGEVINPSVISLPSASPHSLSARAACAGKRTSTSRIAEWSNLLVAA
ncbi:hypothetical protein [Streptomyces agglomeratus]|uniref:hypothetical protein n=1 Tax=Streptomyces agglomeratus TaxID=285458 RepID=UPI0008525001|nr:hypothetical protein [Streptomyces agglomeratus]OEJ49488.1 hypothetical protein BGK72_00280 [Streptomyces agglomeratus]